MQFENLDLWNKIQGIYYNPAANNRKKKVFNRVVECMWSIGTNMTKKELYTIELMFRQNQPKKTSYFARFNKAIILAISQ